MSQNETHLYYMNYSQALIEFGLKSLVSIKELETIYRHQARMKHPDLGGSTAGFQQLQEAYSILKKPTSIIIKSQPKTYKKTSTQTKYIPEINWTIRFIYFWCFLLRFKINTYEGYTHIELNNKVYILAKLPKEKEVYIVLKGVVSKIYPRAGFVLLTKIHRPVYFYFFK